MVFGEIRAVGQPDGYSVLEQVGIVVARFVHGFVNHAGYRELRPGLVEDLFAELFGRGKIEVALDFPYGGHDPPGQLLGRGVQQIHLAGLAGAGGTVVAGLVFVEFDRVTFPSGEIPILAQVGLSHVSGFENFFTAFGEYREAVTDNLAGDFSVRGRKAQSGREQQEGKSVFHDSVQWFFPMLTNVVIFSTPAHGE